MVRTATRTLAGYHAKRDFSRTSEPSGIGSNTIKPSSHLRFVIQKHAATRLHYDLRLELGDVFKSWAVTRGPSLAPGEKRLAVSVEDHPLDYGDFEGTIPEGEYGGGTVMVWDRGFWAPETATPPEQSLDEGELKFVMAGEKMKGSFVLVRLKPRGGEKRENWLLIKHKDAYATPGKDTIQTKDRSVASGRTMNQIARRRGASAAPFMTVGKAVPAAAIWDREARESSQKAAMARRGSQSIRTTTTMPKLTHPERVLWPGDSLLNKHDLAEYLILVAPWMIRHIHGRPCSLVRAPDGIDGEHFFQRHTMAGQPATIAAITVDREHRPYVQINDAQTIVAMAQFSVLEFHPWNSAPHQPRVPGRLIFDLDPAPDVPFDSVIGAAREMRALLESIGLIAFCKTTGGKGLHVVTPLVPDDELSWDQAELFAQTVAARLADEAPTRYLVSMSKKKRVGRIFIDYLRNDAAATAVAPLSPRARPGAPVSMPLTWAQVKKGLDPKRFTLRTAPALLTKSRAWNDYDKSARPLRTAIEALLGTAP